MFKAATLVLGISSVLVTSQVNASVVLTFEGVGDFAQILDFYNGGTDSQGHAGINYGVNFSSGAIASIDSDAGGAGQFANEPSPSTVMSPLFIPSTTMNVSSGFKDTLSFFYTALHNGSVTVYSELGGTGSVLATTSFTPNYNADGCTGDPTGAACHWEPIALSFNGVGKSVIFADAGGGGNGFDNITINAVPIPTSVWLFLSGLASVFSSHRKRST